MIRSKRKTNETDGRTDGRMEQTTGWCAKTGVTIHLSIYHGWWTSADVGPGSLIFASCFSSFYFLMKEKRGERKRQQSHTSDGNQTGNSLNSTTAFKSIHKSVKWKTPRSIVTRCIRYIFILLFAVSSSKSNPRRSRKKSPLTSWTAPLRYLTRIAPEGIWFDASL